MFFKWLLVYKDCEWDPDPVNINNGYPQEDIIHKIRKVLNYFFFVISLRKINPKQYFEIWIDFYKLTWQEKENFKLNYLVIIFFSSVFQLSLVPTYVCTYYLAS